MNINLNYTDKSFTVSGSTKDHKEELMALGGKYNPHLKTGPGYIFGNKKEDEVRKFIESINNDGSKDQDILSINNSNNTNSTNNTNKKKLIIIDKSKPSLLSTNTVLNYPNRFIAADNLSYQIIVQTCILPHVNQKVTVNHTSGSFDSTVININENANDILLTYQEDDTTKQTRAVIINGKWQIHLLATDHELIFH